MSKYKTNKDALEILSKSELKFLHQNALDQRKQPFEEYTNANYRIDYIQMLFEWRNTSQGWDYWLKVHEKWKNEFLKQKTNGSS